MLKHLYRAIILICVFFGAVYFFSKDIKEEVFRVEQTTKMSKASFPVITMRLGEEEINLLHGYSNNINANLVRESMTPLDQDQSFVVAIDEKENDVKRVVYELRNTKDNKLLETDTINALEKEDDKKTAKIKFKVPLEEGIEYAVKITLITSESKKMNYYTRIKIIPYSFYKEKLDFALDFHNKLMNKKKAEEIIAFLEPEVDTDTTSLAYVNIHSSFELVSWGDLRPKLVGSIVPTIKEIDKDMSTIELKYLISAETDRGVEYFNVKEIYRVRYTSSRMYLLNYERIMESVFDMNLTDISKKEFKIGITNQPDIELVTSSDNNKVCFVRQRELWYYDLPENTAVKVFSFKQKDTDNIRDTYQEHDIRILNMDDDGSINFIVFGYMNRGVYEGRVGIVLYKFYSNQNRIEELAYVPINTTYQMLKEKLGTFSYVNQFGTFYFTMNNKIYSYSLIKKELTVVASNITNDNYVVSKEQHYIVWQNNNNPTEATIISILDLESGEKKEVTAPEGRNIILLGKIDQNFIYGYTKTKDIATTASGSILVPMYKLEISDAQLTVLKEYKKKGYYVTDATVLDNVITLERMIKVNENGKVKYELAEPDSILDKITKQTKKIALTSRMNQNTLTEYYISLPAGFVMEKVPEVSSTINTVITEDTTLRLEEEEEVLQQYIVYALGDIKGIYDNVGEAVNQADSLFGSVLDTKQQIIWQRSIKSAMTKLENITPIFTSGNIDSITSSVQMMINYRNGSINSAKSNEQSKSAYELLNKSMKNSVLNLTGCSLDEVLYYITNNRPVLAMKDSEHAVLIIGYDAYNITVIDPSLHMTMKIGLQDGMEEFKAAGNIFMSYLDR